MAQGVGPFVSQPKVSSKVHIYPMEKVVFFTTFKKNDACN